MRAINIKMWIL